MRECFQEHARVHAGELRRDFIEIAFHLHLNVVLMASFTRSVSGHQRNPKLWLYDNVESCCSNYFHWSLDECLLVSGGSSGASPGTGKWYVNHKDSVCQRDCAKEDGDSCGGTAKRWETPLYDSAAACCKEKLSWISLPVCEAKSTSTTAVGSFLWFVDFSRGKVRSLDPDVHATFR